MFEKYSIYARHLHCFRDQHNYADLSGCPECFDDVIEGLESQLIGSNWYVNEHWVLTSELGEWVTRRKVSQSCRSLSDLVELVVEKSAVTGLFVVEKESHCQSSDALFEESLRRERRQEKHGYVAQFLEMQ